MYYAVGPICPEASKATSQQSERTVLSRDLRQVEYRERMRKEMEEEGHTEADSQ